MKKKKKKFLQISSITQVYSGPVHKFISEFNVTIVFFKDRKDMFRNVDISIYWRGF